MESARCRAFVTSVDQGSFTAAGRMLDYTPSGVSQLVRALEEELGLKLLTRKNRGVTLTKEGERIYPQIVDYLSKEDMMFRLAKEVTSLKAGQVTIATFTSIATHILPGIIRSFSKEYRNIGIKIIEGSKVRIEEMLADNTADLAFVSRPDNPAYTWIPFMKDRIVAMVSKDHRLAGAGSYPIGECLNDDLIMPDNGRDMDIINMFRSRGLDPEIKYSTIENYTAINMAAEGLGVNIVNEFITRSWKNDCVMLPLDPPADVEFGIVLPSEETVPPAVRKFISYAAGQLGQNNS